MLNGKKIRTNQQKRKIPWQNKNNRTILLDKITLTEEIPFQNENQFLISTSTSRYGENEKVISIVKPKSNDKIRKNRYKNSGKPKL